MSSLNQEAKTMKDSVTPSVECQRALRETDDALTCVLWRIELALLVAFLVTLNLPLIFGASTTALAFHPAPVRAGEWWRMFTHPFVHVSWYHLVLDAVAFFLGYVELRERTFRERLLILASSGAGSLLAACWLAPAVVTQGLCGLSGIAHGLAALAGLEMFRHNENRWLRAAGFACFAGVVGKGVIEAVTGQVMFASLHLGSLGTPIAVCHAGGVLGALIAWLAGSLFKKQGVENTPV